MPDAVSYHPLSACPIGDAVRAWNDGFADYYPDMTTTAENLGLRMRQDGVVAEASIGSPLVWAVEPRLGITDASTSFCERPGSFEYCALSCEERCQRRVAPQLGKLFLQCGATSG